MSSSSGDIQIQENAVLLLVRNKGDVVYYLITKKKKIKLSFDDKMFIDKLKPCPAMPNLIMKDNRGNKNRSFNPN